MVKSEGKLRSEWLKIFGDLGLAGPPSFCSSAALQKSPAVELEFNQMV